MTPVRCAALLLLLMPGPCLGSTLAPDAFEPDDVPANARLVPSTSSFQGTLHAPGDVDWSSFSAIEGRYYALELTPLGTPNGLADAALEVFDTDGRMIAFDDDRGLGLGASFLFRAERSGIHYLKVRAATGRISLFSSSGGGPETLGYSLSIAELINGKPMLDGVHLAQASVAPSVMLLVTAAARDPDGDDLRFDFDWGDGTKTFGAIARRSHAWASEGVYCVRVRARDVLGTSSGWSACAWLTVDASALSSAAALLAYCTTDYSALEVFEVRDAGGVARVGAIPVPSGNAEKPFVFRRNDGRPAAIMNSFVDSDLRKSTVFVDVDAMSERTVRPPSQVVSGRFDNPIYSRAVHLRDGRLLAVTSVVDTISNQDKTAPSQAQLEVFESDDQGASWRQLSTLVSDPADTGWSGLWQPSLTELDNGHVMLAAVEQAFRADRVCPDGSRPSYRDDTVYVARSRDGGRTWDPKVRILLGPCGADYNEPALAQLPTGDLLLVAHQASTGSLVVSYGTADARQWAAPAVVVAGSNEVEHRYPVLTPSAAGARLVFRSGARGQGWNAPIYQTTVYASGWGQVMPITKPAGLAPCKLQ
jgi:hypothetical protein